MELYRRNVLATVTKYGGKYMIVGGPKELLEGHWEPEYPILIEFPDQRSARKWYNSNEYQPLKTIRNQAAVTQAVYLEGI